MLNTRFLANYWEDNIPTGQRDSYEMKCVSQRLQQLRPTTHLQQTSLPPLVQMEYDPVETATPLLSTFNTRK